MVLERCAKDKAFRASILRMCSEDFVFWCDVFSWTYNGKDFPMSAVRPFILYDFQEGIAADGNEAIGAHDFLVPKGRQLGISWLFQNLQIWRWLFSPMQSFLNLTRDPEMVDKRGDPKSTFWRFDFILSYLPEWMRPPVREKVERKERHLFNPLNKSVINGIGPGDSEDLGRGDVRTAVWWDEMPHHKNADMAFNSAQHTTNSRIGWGSHNGEDTLFYRLIQKGAVRSREAWWHMHPGRKRGLYRTADDGRVDILDKKYVFPDGYEFVLDRRLRSPYFDWQEARADDRKLFYQEVAGEAVRKEQLFFDYELIRKLRASCRPAYWRGELENRTFMKSVAGRLKLWMHEEDLRSLHGRKFCVACDISYGAGATPSVASIADKATGRKVGEFVTDQSKPSEFAESVVELCHVFNHAYLAWESNGPGREFGERVIELGYKHIYWRRNEERVDAAPTTNPGFRMSRDSKKALMGRYQRCLATGEFVNPSDDALRQCLEYIVVGDKVNHAGSMDKNKPLAYGSNHGDYVIADAMCCYIVRGADARKEDKKKLDIHPTSLAARRREREIERRRRSTEHYSWIDGTRGAGAAA